MSVKINKEIECLRAVAILMVLWDHLTVLFNFEPRPPPLYGADPVVIDIISRFIGWTGVDLFFAISGYVISLSFVEMFDKERAAGNWWNAIKAFWTRRFFRIIPSAWFWVAVMLVGSLTFNRAGQFSPPEVVFEKAVYVFFYVANFFAPHAGLGPLSIYWSLALEEQFYFLLPFFLLIVPIKWRWKMMLLFVVLLALPPRTRIDFPAWHFRVDAMLWGCIVYQLTRMPVYLRIEPKWLANKWLATLVSFALIAALGLITVYLPLKIRFVSLIAIVSGLLVFLASYQKGYVLPMPRPLRAVMMWIGTRSFALYLVHVPAFHIVYETWFRIVGGEFDRSYMLVLSLSAFPTVILLSELNYRLIETPLRIKGATIAKRMVEKGRSLSRAPTTSIS
ncbi:acyltransferase family protein [Labrys neptuniae]